MTKLVTLVHREATVQVPARLLISKCDLFADDPGLAAVPYHFKCRISLNDFRPLVFGAGGLDTESDKKQHQKIVAALRRVSFLRFGSKKVAEAQIAIPITEVNDSGALFADRFMFTSENATFECSVGHAIALSPAVREQLSVDACAHTFVLNDASAVNSVRCLLSGDAVSIEESRNGLGRQLCSPGLELALAGTDCFDLDSVDLSIFSVEVLDEVLGLASFSIASEDALLELLLSLGDEYRPLLRWIEIRFLSVAGLTILTEHFAFLPECVFCGILDRLPGWNSAIVPDFPKLFEDFKEKQFTLLWRGSRDGFAAHDFHSRCDGHAKTLTVILDTKGNIFGGFTPVEWDSRPGYKADPSLKSFLFTLKIPHNVPPRRFALRAEQKDKAIYCGPASDPHYRYTNDTGLEAERFFTGSKYFQAKEIEVFEITN
jgi:hypothetical protein